MSIPQRPVYASPEWRRAHATLCSQLLDRHVTELTQRGWTVVENVVTPETCTRLIQQWLTTIESYDSGFRANDKTTWTPARLPVGTRGMQDWPPVAHEPFAWRARLELAPLFAKLWGCASADEMVTSFDRVCFVPSTSGKVTSRTADGWIHLDQTHPKRRGQLECVQGFLTLQSIGASEVALEVYSGAHIHHGAFFEWLAEHEPTTLSKLETGNFCRFSEAARAWYLEQSGVTHTRVHAPAGAVVLWDSRLPHHAMAPRNATERSSIDRHVIYVSMLPRRLLTERKLAARVRAYENQRATSHWPQDARLFPEMPWLRGRSLPPWTYSHQGQRRRLLLDMTPDEMARIEQLVGYYGRKRERDDSAVVAPAAKRHCAQTVRKVQHIVIDD